MAKVLKRIASYYWDCACAYKLEDAAEFLRLEALGNRAYDLYLSLTLYERTYIGE